MFCTIVFLDVVYGRRYVTMCIGCFVLSHLFCFTMHSFTTHATLVTSYTHTSHVLFISFLGVLEPRVSLKAASIPRGRGKVCLHPTLPRPYK
ncbi:hypothetical protein Hanom_Chr04g00308181 [Helianthus anomalus]